MLTAHGDEGNRPNSEKGRRRWLCSGRPVPMVMAALRCPSGRGKRLKRCGSARRGFWWGRFTLAAPPSDESATNRAAAGTAGRRRRRPRCAAARLGFWESAPGWWRPLIKGRAHPLACGPRLGGGAGVRGRDSLSPARARRGVRDDKGAHRSATVEGGRQSGPCWANSEVGLRQSGGLWWPGGKDQGARADLSGWAWPN
jgi:hypothetical protein